jgi:hypothetical protein
MAFKEISCNVRAQIEKANARAPPPQRETATECAVWWMQLQGTNELLVLFVAVFAVFIYG